MAAGRIIHHDYYVYALLMPETGEPFYIGYGRDDRWLDHEKERRIYNNHKHRVIGDILSRCESVPKIKIAEALLADEAKQLEINLIAQFGRWPHGPLVNKTRGGDGLADPSVDTRRKISIIVSGILQGNQRARGKRWRLSAETRARQSEASRQRLPRTGWKHSESTKKKIGNSQKGRSHPSHVREAISRANKGRARSQAFREAARISIRGRIWITDGVESRRVWPTESIPSGWRRGRSRAEEMTSNDHLRQLHFRF